MEAGVAQALLGRTRSAVLSALLLHPDDEVHVRELERLIAISAGTLHRELTFLAELGLIRRRQVGRQIMFSAEKANPVFDDLAAFLRKTAGIADVLREALEPLRSRIRLAFVYGSIAEGTPGAYSDIDVMVIGDTGFAQVVDAISTVQARLRREVNPTVMRPAEYAKRRAERQGFVASVEEKPKIWLIGSDDELARLGAERTTPPPAADERGARAPARRGGKKHR